MADGRDSRTVFNNNSANISTSMRRTTAHQATESQEDGGITKGERALWRAVITQALMDAGNKSEKKEMKYDRARAISWLSGRSKDFMLVCSLAELDPEYVLVKAREAIKRGCVWRKEEAEAERRKRNLPRPKKCLAEDEGFMKKSAFF